MIKSMNKWAIIFFISIALILYDLLALAGGGLFGFTSSNPPPGQGFPAFFGVLGIIMSLVGYIVSQRRSTSAAVPSTAPNNSWRTTGLFVLAMTGGWVPLILLGIALSNAPDGGSIGGAIIAIGGLTLAIIENVVLVVVTLFVPGFRRMVDAYFTTLVIYGFLFIWYLMEGQSYKWNLYILPLFFWLAFTIGVLGLRFPVWRRKAFVAGGGTLVVGFVFFFLTLPGSYLGDGWLATLSKEAQNSQWCLKIKSVSTRQECLMRVATSAQYPSFCHLTNNPEVCLGNITSLHTSPDACRVISDSTAQKFCLQQSEFFTMSKRAKEQGDSSLCRQTDLKQRSYCMWDAEEQDGRRPNCVVLPDISAREKCLYAYPQNR